MTVYLGVEYGIKYVLEGPNGAKAVFNEPADANFVGVLSPESSGLDGPEIREDSNERVESDGAIFGNFYSGKRPVVLQGEISATSKAQRNERIGKLRAASNGKLSNCVLWWEDAAAGKVFINLRRQQPLRITGAWVKSFQLAMVAADSRILGYAPSSGEHTGLEVHTPGAKFPGTAAELAYNEYTGAWTSIANVKAEDAVFATITSKTPKLILATNFSLAIPSTAIVTSISVGIKGKGYASSVYGYKGFYINGKMSNGLSAVEEASRNREYFFPEGVFTATNEGHFMARTSAQFPLGAFSPTPTVVNAASFGVALVTSAASAPSGALSIDDISLNAQYTTGPEVVVENRGNVNAPTKFIITGPITEPALVNEVLGLEWRYAGSVAAGNKLIVDSEAFTVYEEGSSVTGKINRFNGVAPGASWLLVQPGGATLALGGTGTTGETKLKVEYRDAWE